jgi:hypothetical protein
MDDRFNAQIPLTSVPPEVMNRYRVLSEGFMEQRDFDGSGLRQLIVELQSPRGTLTSTNDRLTVKDRIALVAFRLRWWLAGFLLLRNGLAESVYASHKSLLERHDQLVIAVQELRQEVYALQAQLRRNEPEPRT